MNLSHRKASKILKHWNLEKEPISDIYYEGSGQKSDNAFYAGEAYILKFTVNLEKMKNEIALSRAMESAGLMASTPIMTADGREYVQDGELFFYVTQRVSGTPMVSHNFYEGDYAAKARFVGEIIGQLHLILSRVEVLVNDVNLYEDVKNWALPKAKEILSIPEQFCREYLVKFGELYSNLPKQIIHRNPNPATIIVSQDKWGFIDFELSERNLRIYDPCYAATAVLCETYDGKDQERLRKWVDIYRNIIWGYDSVVKLTDEEKRAIPYVVMANQAVCVAWFSEQEKYADVFEANKSMTRWLLFVFEELKCF